MENEQDNISKLLTLIENAPNPIVKKTLILKLAQFPLSETENIFIALFEDFDERIIAATIESLSSYQKIYHLDHFAKFSSTRSQIIKRTLARSIWLYDINEKIEYCKKIVSEGQKDKFNFVIEILRGIDISNSLAILEDLKLVANSEISEKASLYQKELREKLSLITPVITFNRKKTGIIAALITLTIGIGVYLYFNSNRSDHIKTVIVKKPVLTEKTDFKKSEKKIAVPKEKITQKKINKPKITKPIKKDSSALIQSLINKKKYLEAQKEMIKLIPKLKNDRKFHVLLIKVNSKLNGDDLDEIIRIFDKKVPIAFYVHQVKMAAKNKKDYINPLKSLVIHPTFSLKIIGKEAFNSSIKDKALSSSFLENQPELIKHFFLNLINFKHENAITIFERIDDNSFKKKFKKLHELLVSDVKYSNLNSEPFKYYSLQLNATHFKSKKDFKNFRNIMIFIFRGKLKKALKVLQNVNFIDPGYKLFLEGIYYSRYLSNSSKSAGKLLEALKLKPVNETEIKFFLGRTYFEVGFYDLAENFFKQCQTESNDSTIKILSYDYLFSIYRKEKQKNGN